MKVKLLKKNYKKNENLYNDFINDNISRNLEYVSIEYVEVDVDELVYFPVYLNISNIQERNDLYKKAFNTIIKHYCNLDREIVLSQRFWHSVLLIYFRDHLLENYPEIKISENHFNNIVIKKFDWENYIYKLVLASQYLTDNCKKAEIDIYFNIILENLDLYNYIIKYRIFRNGSFLKNVLDIINNNDLSEILKAKIKDRPDLGTDERYGRRVIFEFNKNYPVIMSPMLKYEKIEELFFNYLSLYKD